MNDPNGMLYFHHHYQLFFQYYPNGSTWGPMHWGHAETNDLIHWKELPIALYPDKLGYIFSGSAVVDSNNTSGLGQAGRTALVAIFTQHDPAAAKKGRTDYQNQSLAYSLDEGKTWSKYAGNPVLKNPGIADFRDPKVMWYAPDMKWIMTLATKDRISFYSSTDLKNWKKESEFGSGLGAHGGVWECPDLFSLDDRGNQTWILIVNLNPGGPNGGSGTQYFVGSFDGKKFSASDTSTRWLDFGPDEYAGVTWSNTEHRKIFLGWMSNWLYANQVPTESWRNAMTIPRELRIGHAGNKTLLASMPIHELSQLAGKEVVVSHKTIDGGYDLAGQAKEINFPCRLDLSLDSANDFSVTLSNDLKERLQLGFDQKANQYFVDRTRSGKTEFQKDFAGRHLAPRLAADSNLSVSMVIDVSSIEIFADSGLTVLSEIFFPSKPYHHLEIQTRRPVRFSQIRYTPLKSIWP